jgi:hypothetical protein
MSADHVTSTAAACVGRLRASIVVAACLLPVGQVEQPLEGRPNLPLGEPGA